MCTMILEQQVWGLPRNAQRAEENAMSIQELTSIDQARKAAADFFAAEPSATAIGYQMNLGGVRMAMWVDRQGVCWDHNPADGDGLTAGQEDLVLELGRDADRVVA